MTLLSETPLDDRSPVRALLPVRRSRWVGIAAVTVAVLVAVLLARGGPSVTTSTSSVGSGSTSAPVGSAPGLTGGPQPAAGAPQPVVVGRSSAGAASIAATTDGARIVKQGSVDLVVRGSAVGPTVTAVQAIVLSARGYASDSSTTESGTSPVATTTYRVPVASFERVLAQVRQVSGAKVTATTTSGSDVTGAYADTQAQIQSLTAARNRFLTILSRARTIAETLSVQQRVDDVQQQIDQLQSQRRVLASSSDLATLTVSVATKARPERRTAGLGAAWERARHGFASGVESLVAHSGGAALVLLIVALLLGLARLGRRLMGRH